MSAGMIAMLAILVLAGTILAGGGVLAGVLLFVISVLCGIGLGKLA